MTPSPAMLAARRPPAPAPVVAPAPAVQVLGLVEPMPGFPGHREYVLIPADTAGLLFWLQSLATDGPRFLVVPTAAFFPDYAPALPPAACVELELAAGEDAMMYGVVTVPDGDVTRATANLRAPLVVNRATSRGRQIVLNDPAHPVRCPLRR